MNRFFRPRKNIGLLLRARARKGGVLGMASQAGFWPEKAIYIA
jgi:hypothetical protein